MWRALFLVIFLSASGGIANPTSTPSTQPSGSTFLPIVGDALPNAHRVTDKVICGGLPDGELGFKELKALGVQTVISVDGVKPQVELAHANGMRYVHLPFGYDGVPLSQGQAIAKAIADLPGPVYVHCHHGQHRSPAAVAVACVLNGTLAPTEAEALLASMGTGKNYAGLWASARAARPMDRAALAALQVKFVEQAALPPLAEAMVRVDEALDALKAMHKLKWRPPADHPDLDAGREALQLEELLVEIGRTAAADKPAEFRKRLGESVGDVKALREALGAPAPGADAEVALQRVAASCTSCHRTFRDTTTVRAK